MPLQSPQRPLPVSSPGGTMAAAFKDVVSRLLYPPRCLQCQAPCSDAKALFCEECKKDLQLLDIQGRCPVCFDEGYHEDSKYCFCCAGHALTFDGIASAFDHLGPGGALVRHLKYSGMPYLAKGLAAAMALQWHRLSWPKPDVIVPAPMGWLKQLSRGYNQSVLIAQEMGRLLNVSVEELLKRRGGDLPQAALDRRERKKLGDAAFSLCNTTQWRGKVVLFVDDVTTTGSTLMRCGEKLLYLGPSKLYAITACKAIRSSL